MLMELWAVENVMIRELTFGLLFTLSLIGSIRTFLSNMSGCQTTGYYMVHGVAQALLIIPERHGARIEMRQKAEPDFVQAGDHDQYTHFGTERTAATESSPEQGVKTPRTPGPQAIRYVSKDGNDGSDGASWDTAKKTIYGAIVSLPGGGLAIAGSGTVYVAPASSANPVPGAGIWLMNPHDPNYANPPAGWLKCHEGGGGCVLNIVGVPNANLGPNSQMARAQIAGGNNSDNNHPWLWISGGGGTIKISNLGPFGSLGRSIVLGECSNHDRSGACQTTSVVLENVGAPSAQGASNGPGMDITGGSYWIWIRDSGATGNAINATGGRKANRAAAVLIDGTGNMGNGLINISDMQLSNGGIKFVPGANGGSLYASNIMEEGDFSHDIPPCVWFTNYFGSMDSYLNNIQMADPGPTPTPIVENDGGGPGPTVLNGGGFVEGPAVVLNPNQQTFASQSASPVRRGQQSGFFNGYVVGQTNAARRIGGLTPARFANKAASDSNTWTATQYTGVTTLTTGRLDPFGGTGATTASSTNSANEALYLTGACAANRYTPTAEDWIVGGVWAKGVPATINWPVIDTCGNVAVKFSNHYAGRAMLSGDGQWEWWWIARKVAARGPTTTITLAMPFSSAITTTAYGPVFYLIPAGTISDNEVLEFVSSMNSVDSNCQAGQICNVAGHPLAVSAYRTLSNCSSVSSPAKCDSAPAGSFLLSVGSTTTRVNTTAVTAKSEILIIEDSSLGAQLGVSCNKTPGRTYMITDRAPGLSFSVGSSFAPTDQPACLSFQVLN